MCHFDYESAHKNKYTCFLWMVFVTWDVSMCDELSIKYNSHKDKVLGIWVILASKHVIFISCIVSV